MNVDEMWVKMFLPREKSPLSVISIKKNVDER